MYKNILERQVYLTAVKKYIIAKSPLQSTTLLIFTNNKSSIKYGFTSSYQGNGFFILSNST